MTEHDVSPGPVVVGVDGSANSRRALAVAASLASATGAEVLAVHALGLLTTIHGERVPASEHRAEIEVTMRDEWCAPLADTAITWRCMVADGNSAEVLLHTAHDESASYVVVGSRGVGGHPDLMLGSTSHQVIQHTPCPAVVVPPIGRTAGTTASG